LNDEQKVLYESDDPDDIPYVSSKDIDVEFKTVNYDNGLRIPKVDNRLRVSPKGSFLMVIEGGSSGRKMVFLDRDVCYVNKLCSFYSIENTKFQYYYVQSYNYQDKFRLSLSGLIGGVSISNLREIELILPPLSEQQQIVSYLDTKTSQIDSLIEKTQRKIELLKENRTSLINEVVTKGLNPNVEMKDSGVEWIGEIPSHWELKRLKYFCELVNEKGLPNEGDVKISPENVESNTGFCFNLYSEYSGDGVKFSEGDILLNKLRLYLKKILFTEYEGYSMGEMIVLRVFNGVKRFYYLNLFHHI
jgi:type I restriction enzyme S subunit